MGRTVWYPGHMARGRRQLEALLGSLDLLLEVRDARAPRLTASPLLEEQGRLETWIVLTKADLAEEEVTRRWVDHFRRSGRTAWAVDARKPLPAAFRKALQQRRPDFRELRLAVVGVPNVGKSLLLNRLIGKKSALVGGIPGVTRGVSWFRGEGLLVVDSPGVLDPKSDAGAHRRLAWLNATKGQVIGTPQDLAMDCIAHLEEQGEWGRIASVWNLSRESQSPEERLEGVGRRLGRLLPGGVVDLDGAGRAFLEALGTGKLGRWSLEVPPASREKEGSS